MLGAKAKTRQISSHSLAINPKLRHMRRIGRV